MLLTQPFNEYLHLMFSKMLSREIGRRVLLATVDALALKRNKNILGPHCVFRNAISNHAWGGFLTVELTNKIDIFLRKAVKWGGDTHRKLPLYLNSCVMLMRNYSLK